MFDPHAVTTWDEAVAKIESLQAPDLAHPWVSVVVVNSAGEVRYFDVSGAYPPEGELAEECASVFAAALGDAARSAFRDAAPSALARCPDSPPSLI